MKAARNTHPSPSTRPVPRRRARCFP
jgi:hypothetical protein